MTDAAKGPALKLEAVRKNYGHVVVVDGIDLVVDRGEFFTLVGPSGSGKTTLLRLIAGFERLDSGRIELAGRDVTFIPPYQRETNTVFQDYALFPHMSVADNIGYGLRIKGVARQTRDKRVQRALDMVRLSGLGGRRPNQLSGGQRQRVAIARAFLKNAPTLILDEATSHLDAVSEAQVRGALDALMRDRTTIVIAHRLSTVRNADLLAVLDSGQLVETGSHSELLARGGLYTRLIRRQIAAAQQPLRAAGN
jgi:putative spermidine/putrescine transport system ATP-binding protein